ncbi:hypothetical protein FRC09_003542 [Ceratobasidium sp. 395]|nr:hypothetical protein FRC09_003542 [Ceratobasidium sp. 395]
MPLALSTLLLLVAHVADLFDPVVSVSNPTFYVSSTHAVYSTYLDNIAVPFKSRALRDKETRELVAKELALYETREELGNASNTRKSKVKREEDDERLLASIARASLEQRVSDLEETVAKQEAKLKAQRKDIARLWELMQGEISGHHGALPTLLSSQPEYRISGDEEEDSDKSEENRRDIPIQTASRGRTIQTARRSRPWRREGEGTASDLV